MGHAGSIQRMGFFTAGEMKAAGTNRAPKTGAGAFQTIFGAARLAAAKSTNLQTAAGMEERTVRLGNLPAGLQAKIREAAGMDLSDDAEIVLALPRGEGTTRGNAANRSAEDETRPGAARILPLDESDESALRTGRGFKGGDDASLIQGAGRRAGERDETTANNNAKRNDAAAGGDIRADYREATAAEEIRETPLADEKADAPVRIHTNEDGGAVSPAAPVRERKGPSAKASSEPIQAGDSALQVKNGRLPEARTTITGPGETGPGENGPVEKSEKPAGRDTAVLSDIRTPGTPRPRMDRSEPEAVPRREGGVDAKAAIETNPRRMDAPKANPAPAVVGSHGEELPPLRENRPAEAAEREMTGNGGATGDSGQPAGGPDVWTEAVRLVDNGHFENDNPRTASHGVGVRSDSDRSLDTARTFEAGRGENESAPSERLTKTGLETAVDDGGRVPPPRINAAGEPDAQINTTAKDAPIWAKISGGEGLYREGRADAAESRRESENGKTGREMRDGDRAARFEAEESKPSRLEGIAGRAARGGEPLGEARETGRTAHNGNPLEEGYETNRSDSPKLEEPVPFRLDGEKGRVARGGEPLGEARETGRPDGAKPASETAKPPVADPNGANRRVEGAGEDGRVENEAGENSVGETTIRGIGRDSGTFVMNPERTGPGRDGVVNQTVPQKPVEDQAALPRQRVETDGGGEPRIGRQAAESAQRREAERETAPARRIEPLAGEGSKPESGPERVERLQNDIPFRESVRAAVSVERSPGQAARIVVVVEGFESEDIRGERSETRGAGEGAGRIPEREGEEKVSPRIALPPAWRNERGEELRILLEGARGNARETSADIRAEAGRGGGGDGNGGHEGKREDRAGNRRDAPERDRSASAMLKTERDGSKTGENRSVFAKAESGGEKPPANQPAAEGGGRSSSVPPGTEIPNAERTMPERMAPVNKAEAPAAAASNPQPPNEPVPPPQPAAGTRGAVEGQAGMARPAGGAGQTGGALGDSSTAREPVHQQVVRGARAALGEGRGSISIRLVPESLGRVHIQLTVEGGSLKARITAEKETTKAMLEQNLAKLRGAFDDNHIQVERISIDREARDSRSQQDERHAPRDQERGGRQRGDGRGDGRNGSEDETGRRGRSGSGGNGRWGFWSMLDRYFSA